MLEPLSASLGSKLCWRVRGSPDIGGGHVVPVFLRNTVKPTSSGKNPSYFTSSRQLLFSWQSLVSGVS